MPLGVCVYLLQLHKAFLCICNQEIFALHRKKICILQYEFLCICLQLLFCTLYVFMHLPLGACVHLPLLALGVFCAFSGGSFQDSRLNINENKENIKFACIYSTAVEIGVCCAFSSRSLRAFTISCTRSLCGFASSSVLA